MRKIENLKQIALIAIVVILILYIIFQARFIILGPSIEINSLYDGQVVGTSTITVSGHADNIAYISLDDRPIFIDEKGDFSEKLIAHPGLGIIVMRARDRFGRTTEKTLRIIYNN